MDTSELSHFEGTGANRDVELFRKRIQDHRNPGLSRNILNLLFKWKWLLLTCFVAVVIPTCIVTLLEDHQYKVTTKILLKASRPQVALSPGGAERILNWPIGPAVLNSEIQILKSWDLVQKAVEKSGYPLPSHGPKEPAAKERAIESLRTRVTVSPVPDSNVIEVSFQDYDSHQAARFLNTLAGLYLEKHTAVHRGSGDAAKFFAQQADLYNTRMEEAKNAIMQFKGKDKIIDLNEEITLNLTTLSKFEGTLKEIQAGIEGAEREIESLKQQVEQQPDQIATQKTAMVNPEVTSLSTKIGELEQQHNELLQRYTSKSRFVLDKENEIAALRKQLEGTQRHVAGETVIAQNKLKETLKEQLSLKMAAFDSFKAKRKALLQEMAPYQQRLKVLHDKTFDLAGLRRDYDLARDAYLLNIKKADELRVSTAMDEEKLINVGIIEDAFAPIVPLGRGLTMALALAAISGLVMGVGIAFILEFFNVTVKDEDDVERFLDVPVLATIREFSF